MKRPQTQKYAQEVLSFTVSNNLLRSHKDGFFRKNLRLRRKGPRHELVLHLKGSQASIRSNNRWHLRKMSDNELPTSKGAVVEHHFVCEPADGTATADCYRLSNGHILFYKSRRRNAGQRKQGAHGRRAVAA